MTAKKKSSTAQAATKKLTPMEDFIGPNLLVDGTTEKPTKDVLKDKDLVLIYFSASWCPPCKSFTPMLVDFYNNQAKDGKLEVVYISSDKDMEEFNTYFGKMPWVAQPVDAASALKKSDMAKALKVSAIPALIVLDVKSGKFVSEMARHEVATAGGDVEKQKQVVETWRAVEPIPLAEAPLTGGAGPMTMASFFYTLLKNPVFIFALMYVMKKLLKLLAAMRIKRLAEGGGGDDVGGGDEAVESEL